MVATIYERNLRIKGFQLEISQQCEPDRLQTQKHELDYMNNNNNKEETEIASMSENKPLKELNQIKKILLCFSLGTNLKTILNCERDEKVRAYVKCE